MRPHRIELLIDVRRFPASRRHPHFARENLERDLGSAGVMYHWMPSLGGRRSPRPDSVHTGWRVAAFRGYADYMETPEFAGALAELLDLCYGARAAIMCAESLWWQCHRRLISDALVALGHSVLHIQTAAEASPHRLISPASMVNGRLAYEAAQKELDV